MSKLIIKGLALVLAMLGLVAVRPAPASAIQYWYQSSTATWYDGPINYSQVLNCYTVIQGSPLYENGIGAWTGYIADPDQGHPSVGEDGYLHVVVYGMGNPCPGGSYFKPTFYLPPGMQWDTSRPIACGYDTQGATAPSGSCPGWDHMAVSPSQSTYSNNESNGMWGVAQGHHWELQFPVTMNQALTNSPLQIHLDVADGSHNPRMLLEAPIYVFQTSSGGGGGTATGAVSVMADQPSTIDSDWYDQAAGIPAKYKVLSAFQAVVGGRGGVAGLQLGTDPTMATKLGYAEIPIPASTYSSLSVITDWDEPTLPVLQAGVRYYWRGYVDPTGSEPATYGPVQSFMLKAGGGVDSTGQAITTTPGGAAGDLGTSTGVGGALTPITPPIPPTPTPPTPTPIPTPPPVVVPPTVAPSLNLAAKAQANVAKPIRVKVSCTVACAGTVKVLVSKKVAKRLGLASRTLGKAKVSLAAAGTSAVKVAITKAALKRIRKAGRAAASIQVKVTSAGQTVSAVRKITLTG